MLASLLEGGAFLCAMAHRRGIALGDRGKMNSVGGVFWVKKDPLDIPGEIVVSWVNATGTKDRDFIHHCGSVGSRVHSSTGQGRRGFK